MIGTGLAGLALRQEAMRLGAAERRRDTRTMLAAPVGVVSSLTTQDNLGNPAPAFVLGVNDLADGTYWIP